jgi:hypothetical protein
MQTEQVKNALIANQQITLPTSRVLLLSAILSV